MMMEFQAIDAIVSPGDGLKFILTDSGEDYLAPACGNACTVHVLTSLSELIVPLVDRSYENVLLVP